ncbi:MAG: hypothetical protein IJ733_19835, partial [Lachnospiraceae bacterium]|nr:hypothetical protein [Lachnospiraceae bacterium]
MSATITLYKVAEGVRWVDDHWSDNKDHDTFDFLRCGRRNFGRCRRPRRYMDLAKGHYGEHI